MKAEEWADIIKAACVENGTYRETFDSVIETLADVMEMRDSAKEQFAAMGGEVIVKRVVNGTSKIMRNPALQVVMDLNTQALAYWRDLGLTPSGLKKLTAEVIVKADTGFEAFLSKVMDE